MTGIDCYFWGPLGGFNPVPGDPDAVAATAASLRNLADRAESQTGVVTSVGADTSSIWSGDAASAFRARLGQLPAQMAKLVTSYREAAGALEAYSPRLRDAQDLAVQALRMAESAQSAISSAQSSVAQAHAAAQSATANYRVAVDSSQPDPAAQVTSLAATANLAQGQVQEAEWALSNAQNELSLAERLRDEAVAQARQASALCAAGLREASAAGIQNPHQSLFGSIVSGIGHIFDDGTSFVEHNWKWLVPGGAEVMAAVDAASWLSRNWVEVARVTSGVLGGVATVAGFMSLIPGVGEIALPVALLASGAATADDALLAATGHGSWTTVALDGVGDLGFGAGEMLGRSIEGVETADELASESSRLEGTSELLKGQIKTFGEAASRWDVEGDEEVITVGRDGDASVTKASDLADGMRGRVATAQADLADQQATIAKNAERLVDLPGKGGANGFTYALRTFKPGEEGNTFSKIASFVDSPSSYANAILHPTVDADPSAAPGVWKLNTQSGNEGWTGPAKVLYRINVGVGTATTGLGGYVDRIAWHDAWEGK